MLRAVATPRTQEERTEEARARLRQAALELFASDGYEATTLAAISLRAGYSRTLAQYHYPGKADLALELIGDRLDRDTQLDLLDCPDSASDELAWATLLGHLKSVTRHYGAVHGSRKQSAVVRGEMALHAAAVMGCDEKISSRVDQLTRILVERVERLLNICRQQGGIPSGTDCHALAVLYVHSIWGLALAMFANPKAVRHIETAMDQIRILLEALRNKN